MSDRPIPRSWNDRVLWLLEHLAGGAGSFPPGSGVDRPAGGAASPVTVRVRVDIVDAAPGAEVVVQLPVGVRHWLIIGFAMVRTAGSAAQMQPRLGEVSAFTAGGLDERVTYDSQGVTIPIRDVFCAPIPVRCDAAGRLYLRPGFNAGADNDGTAEVWMRQAFESEGSS